MPGVIRSGPFYTNTLYKREMNLGKGVISMQWTLCGFVVSLGALCLLECLE